MSYLIWINPATNEVLHPEVVKLVDSFKELSDKEMLYVVLYTDYNSPYKQLPEHDRKRRAMWHSFNENELELIESPRILMAIEDYKALQYDPDIELAKRYQAKIDRFLDQLDKEDTPTLVKKLQEAIAGLKKDIQDLGQRVTDKTMKKGVIRGDRSLSFIEELKSNKKRYLSVIKNKPV